MYRMVPRLALLLAFAGFLSACGNTWEGMQSDSRSNAEAANETIEGAVGQENELAE